MKKNLLIVLFICTSFATCILANSLNFESNNIIFDKSNSYISKENVSDSVDLLYDAANKYKYAKNKTDELFNNKADINNQEFSGIPKAEIASISENSQIVATDGFLINLFSSKYKIPEYKSNNKTWTVISSTSSSYTNTASVTLTKGHWYINAYLYFSGNDAFNNGRIRATLQVNGSNVGYITERQVRSNTKYLNISAPIPVDSSSATYTIAVNQTAGSNLQVYVSLTAISID